MKCFVTGCAGFIGSQLTSRLLAENHEVVGYDNFSTGHEKFIAMHQSNARFKLVVGDLLDTAVLNAAIKNCDMVFHLAANADVRFGVDHPNKDLKQNTIATFNVLEAMRLNGIKRLVFSSTGSVYGEASVIPTPENAPFPIQTSLYGASKLACEALIQAYAEGFGIQVYIFRFVSILGEHYTHGHVVDFFNQLQTNPEKLHVLGNGLQKKSYLYIHDCIDAIFLAINKAQDKINIFNLGTDQYCEVNDSIGWICEHLGLTPHITYSGGERGWVGDNPFIFLDCEKIRESGWKPKFTIQESIIKTISFLKNNSRVIHEALA